PVAAHVQASRGDERRGWLARRDWHYRGAQAVGQATQAVDKECGGRKSLARGAWRCGTRQRRVRAFQAGACRGCIFWWHCLGRWWRTGGHRCACRLGD
ncbi:hypothetical protein OIV83_006562, partial [Microbotryomycetes sp. JL201]